MPANPINVLFLCTHNSARSILAEATLNHIGGGRFKGFSAGSSPRENQQPNPIGLQTLRHAGIATEGLRSKSWDEFAAPDAPVMDFVFTVCDQAAAEVCPVWPGQPISAHWGVADPAAVTGDEEKMHRAFNDAFSVLSRRISLFMCLPIEKLSRLALTQEVQKIGQEQAATV